MEILIGLAIAVTLIILLLLALMLVVAMGALEHEFDRDGRKEDND